MFIMIFSGKPFALEPSKGNICVVASEGDVKKECRAWTRTSQLPLFSLASKGKCIRDDAIVVQTIPIVIYKAA